MAGRGTDIMLGGNAEYLAKDALRREGMEEELIYEATAYGETQDETILAARRHFQELLAKYKQEIAPEAEKVRAAGGLYILGTERHESRRIDNQLRGRAGRQGDPGTTKFVISLEDDLMRLFGGERLQALMNSMGVDDSMPIEAKLLSNSIQSAQARIEGMHFEMRKNVLKYDDVMNRQREIIYSQRRRVLDGESVSDSIRKMMEEYIASSVQQYLVDEKNHEEWNLDGLRDRFMGWITDENGMAQFNKKLDVNTTYILRETQAPEGYEKAADTTFRIDNYGNLTFMGDDAESAGDYALNLYDARAQRVITERKTVEKVEQETVTETTPGQVIIRVLHGSPKTGDAAPLLLVAMLLVAGVLLIVYLQERKKQNK